jgi:hypothetical protein
MRTGKHAIHRRVAGLLTLTVAVAGCGGGGAAQLACTIVGGDGGVLADGAICAEYSGAVVPTMCPAAGIVVYMKINQCPTAGRIGRCVAMTSTSAGNSISTLYFYSPQLTVDVAKSSCTSAGGTFTAL